MADANPTTITSHEGLRDNAEAETGASRPGGPGIGVVVSPRRGQCSK